MYCYEDFDADYCELYLYGVHLDGAAVNRVVIGDPVNGQVEATIDPDSDEPQTANFIYARTGGDIVTDCEDNENREIVLQFEKTTKKGTVVTDRERFFTTPELTCEN